MFFFFLFSHKQHVSFFLSFQKKKDHSTVYEPKVNRIHSTGLSIKTFVCPVIRVLLAQRSVFDGLYIGLRDFYFCLPPPTRQKNTPSITPHDTHTHTTPPLNGHTRQNFPQRLPKKKKNSNNRAARCRKSERRRQPSLHLISGDERRGGNKSFQGETSTTNPRLCAQFFFFLEFTEG